MDAESIAVICDMLKRFNSEYGATILIASHQAEDMFGMCNRMLHVENGSVTEAEAANG